MMFRDRSDAGRQLAARLTSFRAHDPVVLALPRGGVPVGAEIARRLHAPLDVVLVRKIGAPEQPELAVGAIAGGDEPEIVLNTELVAMLDLDEGYIAAAAKRELAVMEQRRREWAPLRPAVDPA